MARELNPAAGEAAERRIARAAWSAREHGTPLAVDRASGLRRSRENRATTPAISGDLGYFLATEILQLLHLAGATGRLAFDRREERAEVFFENGHPMFARTGGAAVRLGDVLVHHGAIRPESLERALAEQQREPATRLGTLLIRGGLVSRDRVEEAAHEVLRRIVFGVMLWSGGRFEFTPGRWAQWDDVRLDLDLDRLILENLRPSDPAAP